MTGVDTRRVLFQARIVGATGIRIARNSLIFDGEPKRLWTREGWALNNKQLAGLLNKMEEKGFLSRIQKTGVYEVVPQADKTNVI